MKIPVYAEKVFAGILYDVYQWEQELFDGSTTTFEMLRRNTASFVIPIAENGKMYILEQEQPGKPLYYSLPGGCGKDGESALDIAKRELLEEAGLESDDWELFKTYNQSGKIDYEKPCYIARNCRKTAEQRLDGGEKIRVKEIDWGGFKSIVTGTDFHLSDFSLDIIKDLYFGKEKELHEHIFHGKR